ncbi:MAG: amino acid adenylation domain-containing protein [Eubacterium sp.]|nr:amino acid adenylation domain-containing protein [Eubacterium sp.]
MRNVLEFLEQSADKYASEVAAEDEFGSCTYSSLLETSRRIGSALAGRIQPHAPVAVFMEKSIDTLCAFFGAVYAGGFYSLMNPQLPEERLKQIRSVLNASTIITDCEHLDLAKTVFGEEKILLIDDLKACAVNGELLRAIRESAADTDPLYANFTSGSTGVPKGVLVSHRSVIDFINNFTEIFSITKEDVIGNQAPFDFDVSVKDIYSAIKTGARLVIIPKRLFSNPVPLLDFICEHEVTTMTWAVSALCLITTFHGLDYKAPEKVNKILFSGEVMPLKHLNAWMDHLPNATFVNLYGPTEITCNCTYHVIDRNRDYENGIPIGKAFPNKDVFLLSDDNTKITEPNIAGEICVRGTALALGYYNAPEQTAKAFVQNPLNPYYPELIYRTGDFGKYDENGDIMFGGRRDFQIKHMGHRIEIEEIEKAINNTNGIERCCCIFDESKSKLYGFYIGSLEKKELHFKLKERLPEYMIPNALRKLEAMPLTPNGKIDRKALINGVKSKQR